MFPWPLPSNSKSRTQSDHVVDHLRYVHDGRRWKGSQHSLFSSHFCSSSSLLHFLHACHGHQISYLISHSQKITAGSGSFKNLFRQFVQTQCGWHHFGGSWPNILHLSQSFLLKLYLNINRYLDIILMMYRKCLYLEVLKIVPLTGLRIILIYYIVWISLKME